MQNEKALTKDRLRISKFQKYPKNFACQLFII